MNEHFCGKMQPRLDLHEVVKDYVHEYLLSIEATISNKYL